MEFQEITVYIIVSSAIIYTIYGFIKTIMKKNEEAGLCSSCPYSTKSGTCSKK